MPKNRKKRSKIWEPSDEEFLQIFNRSRTISEMLLHFGLANKGGNYRTLTKRLSENSIDWQKFKDNAYIGLRCNRGYRPLSDVLVENSNYSRHCLKKRLLKDCILKNICSECGLSPYWNNKNLSLVLDHKNGISNDNRIENLRLLCPNCNSQTDTFAGRNIKYEYKIEKQKQYITVSKKDRPKNHCIDCNTEILQTSTRCNHCSNSLPKFNNRKVERPSKEELEKLVWSIPTTKIALQYNISDKAINKWCKSYNINKPSRGYWVKQK